MYYASSMDPTILTELGSIADQQANPTEKTMQKFNQLLDYAASHPDAVLVYQSSEMVLTGHIDVLYLYETKACSISGGHLFISQNTTFPPNNDAVFTIAKIIKAVMSSAEEAELGALLINYKESIPARQAL